MEHGNTSFPGARKPAPALAQCKPRGGLHSYKILISGAGGFIGSALTPFLEGQRHEVTAFRPGVQGQFDVIINLAGESIMGRWTAAKKQAILESRLRTTALLCALPPPHLYIGASAVGYYSAPSTFLAQVCKVWEEASLQLLEKNVRVVHTRFGMVLDKNGGALKKMIKTGGVLGDGKQIISWISLTDLCRAMQFLIAHEECSGPFNFTTPHPVSHLEMMEMLHKKPRHIPSVLLKLLYGKEMVEEVLLSSSSVYPDKLVLHGFQFQKPLLNNLFFDTTETKGELP